MDLSRRPRRLRNSDSIRDLVRETDLTAKHLIAPIFLTEGTGPPEIVECMPGVRRFNIDLAVGEAASLANLGIRAVILFPCLAAAGKNPLGTGSLDPDGLVLRAIRAIKGVLPNLVVMADVALDPYTDHGHDGVLDAVGDVDNDKTVEILAQMSVLQGAAGIDFVAPSDMMDGRVAAIRRALDAAGYIKTGILAYSAKFASSFYGPFREAVGSKQAAGTSFLDKRSYQLDPANPRAALLEARLDEAEGADILMIKPAGPYLDILALIRQQTNLPLCAYQVSGEFAQIHAAAQLGWLDLPRCRDESLLAIRRAGADMIITYFARDFAEAQLRK